MTFGDLTQTLSSNTVWDVRVRALRLRPIRRPEHRRPDDAEPVRSGDGRHQRCAAAVSAGWRSSARRSRRRSVTIQPALFGADHEWKVGTQVERGEHYGPDRHSWRRQVSSTTTGSRFKRSPRDPSNAGGLFITAAAFASDAVTIGRRLTINAGVRFDHSRAISQDLPRGRCGRTRNRRDHPGPGHALHLERRVATSGRHREAHRRRPDDAARELRAVQPGRVDRRDQPDSSRA